MGILRVTTGTESHKDGFTKIYAFSVEPSSEGSTKEIPLYKLAGAQVGRGNISPAIRGTREEIGGKWNTKSYEMEDGSIFKVMVNQSKGWGSLRSLASMYFKVHSRGPLTRVTIPLVGIPNATMDQVVYEGRFGKIKSSELEAHGITVRQAFRGQLTEHSQDAVFRVSTLEKGSLPETTVRTRTVVDAGGAEKSVSIQRPKRKVQI